MGRSPGDRTAVFLLPFVRAAGLLLVELYGSERPTTSTEGVEKSKNFSSLVLNWGNDALHDLVRITRVFDHRIQDRNQTQLLVRRPQGHQFSIAGHIPAGKTPLDFPAIKAGKMKKFRCTICP